MQDSYRTTTALGVDSAVGLYRAVRRRDGVRVIIKLLRADPPTAREADRLRHEYEIERRIEGPWVLKPQALEERHGRVRLILEDFDGELLSARTRRPQEIGPFLDVAIRLTSALAALHHQGIVHGDLTPANILIDPRTGLLKLLGFGIATPLSRVPAVVTGVRRVEGSPAYMSPEQTGHLNRGVDQRSDLYSLGVTCYELLTGELPFQADDPLGWAHCHIARPPRPLTAIVPGIPPALAAVVMKLLAKQVEERYQSAGGLLSDLQHCREEWTTAAAIAAFPLGVGDVSDRFSISSKLYGRESETVTLTESLQRVLATGRPELVLVSGYPGIGKTSLVRELRRPVMGAKGYFVSGKYDQYQWDIPYATLVHVFQDLLRQILAESDERLATWKRALTGALGDNGRLITELIPQLELIIGAQPPVPRLLPNAAEQRFYLTFQRFLEVCARPEHPLVVFLDDLQWVDPESLRLMTYLLTGPNTGALLLVGAYRDNEVGPDHPLMAALNEVRAGAVPLHDLVLGPLSAAQVTHLVADTLRRTRDDAAPLARLVFDKTDGNPFFAIHFLTMLHRDGLLHYSTGDADWQWDLATIRRRRFTDNVVDLMLGKLRRMPAPTRTALMLGACLGGGAVDAGTLALLTGQTTDQLEVTLHDAMGEGLLWQENGSYLFLHDRIQEAAYALLVPAQRESRHLQIGRLLLAHTSEDGLAEKIFDIVGQFNRGTSLITSPAEKVRLAELNLLAGRRAKAANAFASAASYLTAGRALLDPGAWQSQHELSFNLHVELAECDYLVANFGRSEELLALAGDHADGLLERARVYRLRQRLLQLSGRFHEAVSTALTALELFGVSLPDSEEEMCSVTEAEIASVAGNLRGRRVADLADVPLTADAEVRALIGLLAEAMPLIYLVRPLLWPPVTAKGVNVCLQRGPAEESPFVYSCYAMVLVGVCRDIPSANQFSEMALELNERLPTAAVWRGKLLLHHGALISVWRHHVATSLPLLDQSFQACLNSGDLVHAGYTTYNAVWLHLENGDPLQDVVDLARRYGVFARQNHNEVVAWTDRVEEQFALSLQGRTRSLAQFDDRDFDEAGCVAALERAGFGLGVTYHHIMKQVATFFAGRFDEALEWARRTAPQLLHVSSMLNEATHDFFYALALTSRYEQAAPEQQQDLLHELQVPLGKLKLWAQIGPDNFAHRWSLVSAELARIERRDTDAMCLYDQAIGSARENGFVHYEGLAFEVASRFYRSRGFDRIAGTYLRGARDCYVRWGADGLVQQLDQQHPELVELPSLAPMVLLSARAEQLDLLSVVKASQAISGQILLPQLQETLIRLALEYAGAQRGCLLLADGEQLAVHAVAEIEGDRTRVDVLPAVPASSSAVPLTLLNYIVRSGELVLLADAAAGSRFSGDAYLTDRRPRSVLGLPLTRQGQLVGILYLENNLIDGAFIPGRLAVLELLAAQAAISLETARLYAELQQENADRRRAEDEVRLLNRELEGRVLDRTAELKASNDELEAFAYSVSHDLRAPLRAIQGFTGILMREHAGELGADARQLFDKVLRRSERMGQLIDDLLAFSRMGRKGLSVRPVDLGEVVQDVLRDLEPEVRDRVVDWRIARLPVVTGDPAMLRVALVNLISNAVKFTRPRAVAEIEIGLEGHPDEWVFFVRDNGVGFDPRHADKLFGVFQRLHPEESFEGTGIGLANVRRVIVRHGGRVWAEGEVDHGATFSFSLPRARSLPRTGQAAEPPALSPPCSARGIGERTGQRAGVHDLQAGDGQGEDDVQPP